MRRCASQTASPGRGVDKPHSLERTFSRKNVNGNAVPLPHWFPLLAETAHPRWAPRVREERECVEAASTVRASGLQVEVPGHRIFGEDERVRAAGMRDQSPEDPTFALPA